jgi:tetratricopeptide (TPR) repeat protein
VRLYLRLQHLRTFLLLRNGVTNVLVSLRGGRSAGDLEGDATRMESVVGDQRITLGGGTYERGVRQYESNLRAAVNAFRAAGIAVFIASTPSNVRSQRPLSISAVPPDSVAARVFDSASAALRRGDSAEAATTFARARDLDMIRFRAPGEFQSVVKRVARETGSVYVPVLEEVSAESRFGIPGDDLFLEHVHLNQRGYVLIARAFYDALGRQKFLGRSADTSRFAGWNTYFARMRLTDLDHRMAHHTVRTVVTRWPFLPVPKQLDYRGTYSPRDLLDSIAFNASRGGMSWAQAKGMIAAHYAATGETERAVAEYEGLIRDGPEVEVAYRLAGRTLLAANQPERARPYLEKAYSISPTGLTAYALGVYAMQETRPDRGIALFQQALQLTPDMPQALYQLSLAYGTVRNLQGARATAARLAQVEPRFPGLAEWLEALGMGAQ